MDTRSLMIGLILGLGIAGLIAGKSANGQAGGSDVGAFQATIASSGTGAVLVVVDTRTGRYKYHPLPGNSTRVFNFND